MHIIHRAVRNQFPSNATFIPEIKEFSPLNRRYDDIKYASIRLANGTVMSGFDQVSALPRPGTLSNAHFFAVDHFCDWLQEIFSLPSRLS